MSVTGRALRQQVCTLSGSPASPHSDSCEHPQISLELFEARGRQRGIR